MKITKTPKYHYLLSKFHGRTPTIHRIKFYSTKDVFGLNNGFAELVKNKMFIADKTETIKCITSTKKNNILFLAPPRTGKTLRLEMFKHYFDINGKEEFTTLFKGMKAIEIAEEEEKKGEKHASQYHVIELGFNKLELEQDDNKSTVKDKMNAHLLEQLTVACKKYSILVEDVIDSGINSGSRSLRNFVREVSKKGGKTLILIDEYDRGVNDILLHKGFLLKDMGSNLDPLKEPFSNFFATLKDLTRESNTRVLLTGIFPIAISEFSKYNVISKNIALNPLMASSLGFNEQDIKDALKKFVETNKIKLEEGEENKILWICKKYFDGYKHFKSDTHIYLPQLICNFIEKYFSQDDEIKKIANQLYQKDDNTVDKQIELYFTNRMDDPNLRVSSAVIQKLAKIDCTQLILEQLLSPDGVTGKVNNSILTNPPKFSESVESEANNRFVHSILYHAGYTTIHQVDGIYLSFKIPNKVVSENFYKEILTLLGEYKKPSHIFLQFLQSPSVETLSSFFELFTNEKGNTTIPNENSLNLLFENVVKFLRLESRNFTSVRIDQPITSLQSLKPDFYSKRVDGIYTDNKEYLIGWEVKFVNHTKNNSETKYCNYNFDFDANGNSNYLTADSSNPPIIQDIDDKDQLFQAMENQILTYLSDIKRSFQGSSSTMKAPHSLGSRDNLIPTIDPSNENKKIRFYSVIIESHDTNKHQRKLSFEILPYEFNDRTLSEMVIEEENKDLFYWKNPYNRGNWKFEKRTVNWIKNINWK